MSGNIGGTLLLFDALTIDTTGVYYSQSVRVRSGQVFGVWYKATSVTGTPNIKIEVEESYDKPTTEKAIDAKYVVPENMSPIVSILADEDAHVKSVTPTPMQYLRIRVTGNGGASANPDDTLLTLYLFMQEQL